MKSSISRHMPTFGGGGSSKSGHSHMVQTFHFLIMVRLMTPESLSIHYTVYMNTKMFIIVSRYTGVGSESCA